MTQLTTGWGGIPPAPGERRGGELSAARRLLRRLVQLMAAPISPQERLDRMVRMIAADIVAEVCSAYVLRGGDYLELFATEGLKRSAVHRTRLRVGEGLVGLIAAQGAVVNLADAQSHPDFAYRPETGEEIYHSFLGVPIVHSGRVIGVLVVQNRTQRLYSDEEVEALQIVDGEHREVLEAYRMFAHDAGWRRRINEAIRTGLTAEAAVRRVQEESRLRMAHIVDPYLKERLHDLDALADRLLVHLTGRQQMHDPEMLPDEFILVARSLSPAELLDYDRTRLRGVILEEGSPTSHMTIVAQALDIPMVGRVEGAMSRIGVGDRVALDGDN